MSERECFYCDGTGFMLDDEDLDASWDKKRCEECDGTGFEPEEE